MSDEVQQRKAEHVDIALQHDISAPQQAAWHDIHLIHQALPDVDLAAVDTATDFLGHTLRAPVFVS